MNYYSNFLTVVHIVHNGKNGTHTEAQSFEILKLKNLSLKNPQIS